MDTDSSQKLRFRILDCTSEDPKYPVSELLTSSSQSNGWQSQRFCSYPQHITIQFLSPVTIRQLQFLAHETKIPSKLEIQYALPDIRSSLPQGQLKFKKLGYLTLDPNEKSNFKLRELKTVHIEAHCLYLRLVFHKCHINKHNFFNQIGLISFSATGGFMGSSSLKQLKKPEPTAPLTRRKRSENEIQVDEATKRKIHELEEAKQQAIEAEDFEEAERIKQEIFRLEQLGGKLLKVEERKAIAIMNEDYETAQYCKSEIVKIRNTIAAIMNGGGYPNVSPQKPKRKVSEARSSHEQGSRKNTGSINDIPEKKSNMQRGNAYGNRDEEYEDENGEEMEDPEYEEEREQEEEYEFEDKSRKTNKQANVNSYDEMVIPALTKKKNGDGNFEEDMQSQDLVKKAEELTPANQKKAEPLIPVIGEELCKMLFSKHWNLREEAVKTLINEVPKEGHSKVISYSDPWEGFVTLMGVLSFVIVDKVNHVSSKAVSLLMIMMGKKPSSVGSKNELVMYIDICLNTLLEKIGDTNFRVREQAEDAIMSMVRNPVISCNFCLIVILKDMVPNKGKGAQSAKHTLGRIRLLQKIVKEFKIDNNDVPYLPVVDFAVEKLENPSADVRSAAVNLLVDIHGFVGEKLMKDLDGIRPAHLEMLEKEFGGTQKKDGEKGRGKNTNINSNTKEDKVGQGNLKEQPNQKSSKVK